MEDAAAFGAPGCALAGRQVLAFQVFGGPSDQGCLPARDTWLSRHKLG